MGEQEMRERVGAESVSLKVIMGVAKQEDVDPTELPPLNYAVDADALDALFANKKEGNIRVEFSYNGHEVQIESGDEPRVRIEWPFDDNGVC